MIWLKRLGGRLLAISCSLLFIGCANTTVASPAENAEETRQIVCTIFPLYDWIREIVGDIEGIEVTLLIQNGTDLHSYQPSVKDIAAITQADIFVYVGGESDAWVADSMELEEYQANASVSLIEIAEAEEEVIVPGMQTDGHDHEEEEEEEEELDEHVWLSLRRAEASCIALRDVLIEADPAHTSDYTKNCAAYVTQLRALDTAFIEMTEQAQKNVVLVADRFPFRYLMEDYGISYYAAFPGCSAESEASFETIVFLAEQVRVQDLSCILTTESSDGRLPRTIQESADIDCTVLVLDSLQSVTKAELKAGVTYLERMKENLNVLTKALNST